MQKSGFGRRAFVGVALLGAATLGASASAGTPKGAAGKIPVTTSSEEARALYLQGRDLVEKLRATDSRKFFEQAVAKDPDFALARLGLANSAGTAKEFFDGVREAVARADKVSEGERLMILGLDAGARGKPALQREQYEKLVAAFPEDERAHNLLGVHFFGQQDFESAARQFEAATKLNRAFSPAYNMLGYSLRSMDRYDEAEKAFRTYIELIPRDPNPLDSYAELLMKMGRFDESIESYRKALAIDPHFVASFVGIGNDQLFSGKPDEARKTFAQLGAVARNSGERRQAHLWTATSYVHEGNTDQALAELEKMYAIAESDKDGVAMSGDLNLMAEVLLEAGRPDQALEKYREQVQAMDAAQVLDDVKEATRRVALYNEAKVALAKKDVASAKAKAKEYAEKVAVKKNTFEVWLQHELAGRIALTEGASAVAVAELKLSNQQDPRVLYLLAKALEASGDASRAREVGKKAADFNGLAFNYAFVRPKAKKVAGL
jgi:tetratricopeptide (TPR) repeat protein